jgi:hypothetical protein
MLEGPVEGPFSRFRKTAGRKLPVAQVIAQTIAAGAFSGTRFITAVAGLFIFFLTVHGH